jgi:hypothetical protein|tara:strand:- start:201 stop:386 length:186 start_codon:yes stop_codon:yes gene_type:complete
VSVVVDSEIHISLDKIQEKKSQFSTPGRSTNFAASDHIRVNKGWVCDLGAASGGRISIRRP